MNTKTLLLTIWTFLAGKKTYLIAVAAAAYGIGIEQGLWNHAVWLDLIFAATATASVRHGINAANKGPAAIVAATEQPNKLNSPKDTP